jgi:hypothetical protein
MLLYIEASGFPFLLFTVFWLSWISRFFKIHSCCLHMSSNSGFNQHDFDLELDDCTPDTGLIPSEAITDNVVPLSPGGCCGRYHPIDKTVYGSIVCQLFLQHLVLGIMFFYWPRWYNFLLDPSFYGRFVGMIFLTLHVAFLLVWVSADIQPHYGWCQKICFWVSGVCLAVSVCLFVPRVVTACGMISYLLNWSIDYVLCCISQRRPSI